MIDLIADGFSSLRRSVDQAADELKLDVFASSARQAGAWIARFGLDQQEAVDRLQEIADITGLSRSHGNDVVLEKIVTAIAPPAATGESGAGAALKVKLMSSAAFVEGFVAPDYLIDGILQRSFLYALTGKTGSGKTTIALYIAFCAALARLLCGREVTQGRVLILAGENPDDVRMRWIALCVSEGVDPATLDVTFVDGTFKISDTKAEIHRQMEEIGPFALIIVDTSAAFFEGGDDNANPEMLKWARTLRELTSMPGRPTILVTCHPTKNAGDDNLIPRGGYAFLAEIDGNLTCRKNGDLIEVHTQGKFRGPEFAPLAFKLLPIRVDRLRDSRGRQIPSIVAKDLTAAEQADAEKAVGREEDKLLMLMTASPGASLQQLAELGGWPHKMKVSRLVDSLKADKLVTKERGSWRVNDKGRKEAEKLQFKADVVEGRDDA